MIPVGTKVRIEIAPGLISIGAGRFAGETGEVVPPKYALDPEMSNIRLDNGYEVQVYDREIQVLDLAPAVRVMNGMVSIGDTVAWPQRTGSFMWMTIGVITNIDHIITGVTPVGNPVHVGDGSVSVGFKATQTETKITIVTNDGTKKSTKGLDRVVKVCPTTTY